MCDIGPGDRGGGVAQTHQLVGLRIGAVLQPRAAALVGFADGGQAADAFRTAEAVAARQQVVHGRVAQLAQAVHVEMFAAGDHGQVAVRGRHAQAFAQLAHRTHAALLVLDVLRQLIDRRQRLAEVVHQRREADLVVAGRQRRGHVADQLDVHAGVDLGVVLRALRHAVERIDFGQHRGQRAAVMQGAQEGRGPRRAQRAHQLLPDALGHQFGELAALDHAAHQRAGLVGDGEAERGEARHEARRAQHAQRILGEGRADVAQHARLEIAFAAMGVDQAAILALRDGVDGEVAAAEVLFQRHRGRGVDHEAAMPARRLALGARQRVLLAGVGMQEHREVAPDRAEARGQHRVGRRTDHHPVAIPRRQPEQPVTHRAADEVHLTSHRRPSPVGATTAATGAPPGRVAAVAAPTGAGHANVVRTAAVRPSMRSLTGTGLSPRRQS